ncbi:hypothetical protein ACI765_10185 [Capnocytophaga canimorsus]
MITFAIRNETKKKQSSEIKIKAKRKMRVVKIKNEVLEKLKEDERAIAHLFLKTNVPITTLKRWITANDEKLTMYGILLAISEITQTAITEIVEIEEN